MASAEIVTFVEADSSPFAKAFNCTDSDGNNILIIGRDRLVSLGVTNSGNAAGSFGALTNNSDVFGLVTATGADALTGWTVMQDALEAEGITFSDAAQAQIDAYLAESGVAYAPDAVRAWSTVGVDDSLLADITD